MGSDEGRAVRPIYIPLLDEGTDCWRPTDGRRVRGMTYEVLATPKYDPEDEQWEFVPGTLVDCQYRKLSEGVVLVAYREAAPMPALPPVNPGIRLAKSSDVAKLRTELLARRTGSGHYVGDVLPGRVGADPRDQVRDLIVLALGDELPRDVRIEPLDRVWRSIPLPEARELIRRVLGHDLAYHDSMLTKPVRGVRQPRPRLIAHRRAALSSLDRPLLGRTLDSLLAAEQY